MQKKQTLITTAVKLCKRHKLLHQLNCLQAKRLLNTLKISSSIANNVILSKMPIISNGTQRTLLPSNVNL